VLAHDLHVLLLQLAPQGLLSVAIFFHLLAVVFFYPDVFFQNSLFIFLLSHLHVKFFLEGLFLKGVRLLYLLHCEQVVSTAAVFKKNDVNLPNVLLKQRSVFEVDVIKVGLQHVVEANGVNEQTSVHSVYPFV
jgi:hypothetical protein